MVQAEDTPSCDPDSSLYKTEYCKYQRGSTTSVDGVDVDITISDQEPAQVDVMISDQEPPMMPPPRNGADRDGNLREEMRNRMEERRTALSLDRQDRIINLSRNMEAHMQAAVARLEQIIGRLESRMRKLDASGIDVSKAQEILELAKTSLATAKNDLVTVDTLVVSIISGDTARERFGEVRTIFISARNAIRDTHVHLQTVIGLLKEAAITPATTETGTETQVTPDADVTENSETDAVETQN